MLRTAMIGFHWPHAAAPHGDDRVLPTAPGRFAGRGGRPGSPAWTVLRISRWNCAAELCLGTVATGIPANSDAAPALGRGRVLRGLTRSDGDRTGPRARPGIR